MTQRLSRLNLEFNSVGNSSACDAAHTRYDCCCADGQIQVGTQTSQPDNGCVVEFAKSVRPRYEEHRLPIIAVEVKWRTNDA